MAPDGWTGYCPPPIARVSDIINIDENHALIEQVQIDFDVRGVIGVRHHTSAAGVDAADMLIAVTHFDEINMVIRQISNFVFRPDENRAGSCPGLLDPANAEIFPRPPYDRPDYLSGDRGW